MIEKQHVLPLPKCYGERGGNINNYKIACELLKYAFAAFHAAGKKTRQPEREGRHPDGRAASV